MAYENLTLEDFLKVRLKSYGDIEGTLRLFVDGVSPEYQAFHQKTLAKHTALVEFKYKGKHYHLMRASNIRNTTGYLRYTMQHVKTATEEANEPNIAFRIFREGWETWNTIPLPS